MLHPVAEQAHQPLSSGYADHEQVPVQHKSRERDDPQLSCPFPVIDHLDLKAGQCLLDLVAQSKSRLFGETAAVNKDFQYRHVSMIVESSSDLCKPAYK